MFPLGDARKTGPSGARANASLRSHAPPGNIFSPAPPALAFRPPTDFRLAPVRAPRKQSSHGPHLIFPVTTSRRGLARAGISGGERMRERVGRFLERSVNSRHRVPSNSIPLSYRQAAQMTWHGRRASTSLATLRVPGSERPSLAADRPLRSRASSPRPRRRCLEPPGD